MNSIIWMVVALKLFVVCWLVYILLERRKRKKGRHQNVIIIEEGPAPYAGGPVTQMPKDCQEFYNQQLYASTNMMPPPNMQQQQEFYSNQQPPPMMMSPK